VLAESALEIIPSELRDNYLIINYSKKVGKSVGEIFLDKSYHYTAMKEKNIGTGLHYRAVHLYPYYRQVFGFNLGDFPHAEDVCERIVSLPLFPLMTDADHDRVLDVMYSVFN